MNRELESVDIRYDLGGEHELVYRGQRVPLSRLGSAGVVRLAMMQHSQWKVWLGVP